MNRIALLLLLLWHLLLAAGCGFQLRGATEIPPQLSPVYVETRGNSQVRHPLHTALRAGGAEVTGSREQAGTVIRILAENQDSRVNAVDSQGKVVANELLYWVTFDAVKADGTQLAIRQTIRIAREHINPEDEVIGRAEEANMIRRDMAEDMADRILRRLKAQLI
jgi:LPS-assembly lipoprotein